MEILWMLLITIVIHKLRHGAPATMLNYNPLGGLELWAPSWWVSQGGGQFGSLSCS